MIMAKVQENIWYLKAKTHKNDEKSKFGKFSVFIVGSKARSRSSSRSAAATCTRLKTRRR